MKLSYKDYQEFLHIHLNLVLFAGRQAGLIDPKMTVMAFSQTDAALKMKVRSALYDQPQFIDAFVKENPAKLSAAQLSVAKGFKDFVRGSFFVVKYLKKHAIFLDQQVAYGVLALGDPFKFLIGDQLPLMVETVLLPYKGKIVYDGILQSASIYFGSGIAANVQQSYQQSKARYGIVTSLPFTPPEEDEVDPEATLDFYMKSAKNRSYYEYEIDLLLQDHPHLEAKYIWHWGRIHSRSHKKALKELGITQRHYAMVNNLVIAESTSAAQLRKNVKAMLPKSKWDWVFYFQVK